MRVGYFGRCSCGSSLFLKSFEYKVVHRSNKQMFHVDALSRVRNILVLEANTFEHILPI